MALIFVVSGIPSEQIPKAGAWDLLVKKGSHMAAYALLAWLWLRALRPQLSLPLALAAAGLLAVLYAVSDEYHQTFVAGRNGTAVDVLVDSAGAAVGLAVAGWRSRRSGRS